MEKANAVNSVFVGSDLIQFSPCCCCIPKYLYIKALYTLNWVCEDPPKNRYARAELHKTTQIHTSEQTPNLSCMRSCV